MVLLGARGTVEESWETLVDPGCGPRQAHIHGVTDTMLEGAPGFAQVAGDLATKLEGRAIVAHNAVFDVSFLDAQFHRSRCRWARLPLCTMQLARSRGHRPVNRAASCAAYGIVNHGAHHALGDAVATAELLGYLGVEPEEVPGGVGFPSGYPDSTPVHRRRHQPRLSRP